MRAGRCHTNNKLKTSQTLDDLPGLYEVYGRRDSGGHSPKCGAND